MKEPRCEKVNRSESEYRRSFRRIDNGILAVSGVERAQ